MEEAEVLAVKDKIVRGVFALTTRTFILQIIAFISTFILTILLSPSIFGVFFLVSAVISFLAYFSDIGLAAALIQKSSEPRNDELATVFTIQQILVGTIVVIFVFLSPIIAGFFNLNNDGLFLLQALLVSFFLSSLKTIPSILLERKLEFKLLIVPQILETLSFYLVAIILALNGKGIASFAWAAIARGVIGVISIYVISPWRISIGISFQAFRELITFGLPFQANSILALIKDDLMTIFLGKILPLSQVGYIGWAKKWAEVPLRLIMDSVIRVTFPAYARLQKDQKILGRAIEKSLFFLALLTFPATALLIIFIKPFIFIIPKYIKWEPALSSFYFFAVASLAAVFSSPLVNALNAIGKIRITLVLMIMWTVLTWFLVPFFVLIRGFNGVAFAAFIISFTSFLPLIVMKHYVKFQIIKLTYKPFIATLVMILFTYPFLIYFQSFTIVIITFILAVSIYAFFIYFWMRRELTPYIPRFIR